MAEQSVLSDDLLRQLIAVGEVDILIGIPTFNNAKTAGQVARAVQVGFLKYFPRERSMIINPDGGSTDGTVEVVRDATIRDHRTLMTSQPLRTLHRVSTPYDRTPGRANALHAIFSAADLVRAKACAVISGDLQSVTPEWIEGLIRPVYKEHFDLVAPLYHRHKFDGLLLTNILYPMVRSLYGARVREPLGAEFGFSSRLVKSYLKDIFSSPASFRVGADLHLTTSAIRNGFLVCQSFLGPQIRPPGYAEPDLTIVLRNILGTLFECVESDESFWSARTGSEPVPTFGFEYELSLEPVKVNRKRMLAIFQTGVRELSTIMERILSPETLRAIHAMTELDDGPIAFSDELWVRTVYEFLASYRHSVIHRDHLVQALMPLYLGRTSSFMAENIERDSQDFAQRVETLCLEYERLKPYLLERWTQTP